MNKCCFSYCGDDVCDCGMAPLMAGWQGGGGVDDGPFLPGYPPKRKPAPKSAEELKVIRAKAWATRRENAHSWHHRAVMASVKLGKWLSAAIDDPSVCEDMKADIREWFSAGEPFEPFVSRMLACDSDGPRMAETNEDSARGEAGPARAEGIAHPEVQPQATNGEG